MAPGAHDLTVAPAFRRRTFPRLAPDARAAFTGISAHTARPNSPRRSRIRRAHLPQIYQLMMASLGQPKETTLQAARCFTRPSGPR